MPNLLEELSWRGLLYQHNERVADALAAGMLTGYCGFDPTAPSLHVGSLVPVMGLVHLQRSGHRPVALVGGGTGLIGDPSGKATERQLLTLALAAENTAGIRRQLERFLDFSGPRGAMMRDNADWLLKLGAVEFMRDVGKHFTVNYMMAKESVKARIESGISYTEFSYMLLQAYDYLELNRRDGVTLQIGGSDQWGNITAGMELIRRTTGAEAHGITLPLVTNPSGAKFGKTEAGAVWLDPEQTSPYKFYQFWINADDRDTGPYLRFFTLLPREEIEALDRSIAEHPADRAAQQALAFDVTSRVHGEDAARTVRDASRVVFDRHADPRTLSDDALALLARELPNAIVQPSNDRAPKVSVLDLLVATGVVKSKSDARRVLQQGGLSVNGRRLAAEELHLSTDEALQGRYFVVRKGSRDTAMGILPPA
jgi:tyrosyl-tRNA synthetase